jgi:hypothetical protein
MLASASRPRLTHPAWINPNSTIYMTGKCSVTLGFHLGVRNEPCEEKHGGFWYLDSFILHTFHFMVTLKGVPPTSVYSSALVIYTHSRSARPRGFQSRLKVVRRIVDLEWKNTKSKALWGMSTNVCIRMYPLIWINGCWRLAADGEAGWIQTRPKEKWRLRGIDEAHARITSSARYSSSPWVRSCAPATTVTRLQHNFLLGRISCLLEGLSKQYRSE